MENEIEDLTDTIHLLRKIKKISYTMIFVCTILLVVVILLGAVAYVLTVKAGARYFNLMYSFIARSSNNVYHVLHNPTVIDCGESLGMDPWMLHMLPARGCPYNSGSAYIFATPCLPDAFAITNHIAIGHFTALESPSNYF